MNSGAPTSAKVNLITDAARTPAAPPLNHQMARLIREKNWAATPLGARSEWPENLCQALNAILSAPTGMVLLWGPALLQIYNDRYRQLVGDRHSGCLGTPMRDCWPEAWGIFQAVVGEVRQGRVVSLRDQHLSVDRSNGTEDAWFDLTYSPLPVEGTVEGVLVSVTETTEKVRAERALRASERRLAVAVEATGGGVFESTVPIGADLYVSPRWSELLGYRSDQLPTWEAFEAWHASLVHPDDLPARGALLSAFIEGRSPRYDAEFRMRSANDQWLWVRESAQAVDRDDRGRVRRLCGMMRDVTDRKLAEMEILHLARHDPLTQLANRAHFDERLSHAIRAGDGGALKAGLVLLDLDGFKKINDTMGHLAGDELLRIVARRVQSAIRDCDTPARFGGDEFAVVLHGIKCAQDVQTAASRICTALALPVKLEARTLAVVASLGLAVYPDDADIAEGLVRVADRALYREKRQRVSTPGEAEDSPGCRGLGSAVPIALRSRM